MGRNLGNSPGSTLEETFATISLKESILFLPENLIKTQLCI